MYQHPKHPAPYYRPEPTLAERRAAKWRGVLLGLTLLGLLAALLVKCS